MRRPCRAPAERRLAESAWLQRWAVFQDSRPGGCLRSWRCNRRPGASCQSSPVGFWRLLPRTLPDRYYLALSGHCYTSELVVESHVHISNGGPFRTCIWKKLPCCATARKRGRCRQWEPARRESTGRARAAVRVSTTGTIQTRMPGQPRLRKGRTGEAPARWPVPATALSTEQGRHTGETQHSTRSECSGQVPKPLS